MVEILAEKFCCTSQNVLYEHLRYKIKDRDHLDIEDELLPFTFLALLLSRTNQSPGTSGLDILLHIAELIEGSS